MIKINIKPKVFKNEGEKFISWCMDLKYTNKKQNAIKKYIDEGKDINYFSDAHDTNALMYLCCNNPSVSYIYDTIMLLIKSGRCKINERNSNGNSALHFIVMDPLTENTFKLFKTMILMDEIDLNHQNAHGETILTLLCKEMGGPLDVNAAELLINDKRCNLNLKCDYFGRTALMQIPEERYFELASSTKSSLSGSLLNLFKLFIGNERCDLNFKGVYGETIFDYACQYKENSDLVKLLLEAGNRFTLDESKVYPSHIMNYFSNQRNKIGVLLISIKNESKLSMKKKRNVNELEDNPLKIIPKELIHLILSYSHPLASQTKYCLN